MTLASKTFDMLIDRTLKEMLIGDNMNLSALICLLESGNPQERWLMRHVSWPAFTPGEILESSCTTSLFSRLHSVDHADGSTVFDAICYALAKIS